MIKVNDQFSFERYIDGWRLIKYTKGMNPFTKEPGVGKQISYHSTIQQVFNALIDKCDSGTTEDIKSLNDQLRTASEQFVKAVEGLK